jgi:prepilin-type N-terminal cleavage/methylation domain-containing protein
MPRLAGYGAHGARFEGYTLVELVVVITIAGILAAYMAPRFWTQQTFSDRAYVDELAAALRSTQKAAVITGCAAQLTLSAGGYTARQQAPSGNTCNPSDATWSTPLLSADGSAIQNTAPANTTASPSGIFRFDTQGRLSTSPATTVTVGTHTITILAGTGLVQVQ